MLRKLAAPPGKIRWIWWASHIYVRRTRILRLKTGRENVPLCGMYFWNSLDPLLCTCITQSKDNTNAHQKQHTRTRSQTHRTMTERDHTQKWSSLGSCGPLIAARARPPRRTGWLFIDLRSPQTHSVPTKSVPGGAANLRQDRKSVV